MITDYLRNALLNHSLGVAQFPMPTSVWAALYNIAPTASGQLPLVITPGTANGVEVSAPDYARVPAVWNVASLGIITNSQDIRFPVNGTTASNWATIAAIGICDTPTGGNLLFFGPLSAGVTLSLGQDFRVAAGELQISFPS